MKQWKLCVALETLVVLLALAWVVLPGSDVQAQAPAPPPTYQPAYHLAAQSKEMAVFHYRDDVLHCAIFRVGSNGISPQCFEKRPTDESGPVHLAWVAKADPGQVHLYSYIDPVMRCSVFYESSNGIAPVCIDRRGQP